MKHITTIVLTIFLSLFMLSFCMNQLLRGTYENIFANKNMRVDVCLRSSNDNALQITSSNKFQCAKWDKTNNTFIFEDEIYSEWREYQICTQPLKSGELVIALRGSDKRVENERCPILIDYKNLKVNGKEVFSEECTLWHDEPFVHKLNAVDSEGVHISFEARRHHFQIADIFKYYHLNLWILFSIVALSFLISYKLVQYTSIRIPPPQHMLNKQKNNNKEC